MGCRERSAKDTLLRIVAIGDDCVPDPRGTLPGRGAYLHPVPACLDLAVRRRAFGRALRVRRPLDTSVLRRYVEHAEQAWHHPQEAQGTWQGKEHVEERHG